MGNIYLEIDQHWHMCSTGTSHWWHKDKSFTPLNLLSSCISFMLTIFPLQWIFSWSSFLCVFLLHVRLCLALSFWRCLSALSFVCFSILAQTTSLYRSLDFNMDFSGSQNRPLYIFLSIFLDKASKVSIAQIFLPSFYLGKTIQLWPHTASINPSIFLFIYFFRSIKCCLSYNNAQIWNKRNCHSLRYLFTLILSIHFIKYGYDNSNVYRNDRDEI